MGDYTYYLITPDYKQESISMSTFRLWLLDQFSQTAPS